MMMCRFARSPVEKRARGNKHGEKTYHHVAIEILDYKIANILDRDIATLPSSAAYMCSRVQALPSSPAWS
jgi:hypothetical protein